MHKPKIPKFLKSVQRTLGKHSPEILTGIGITGLISTTVIAVRATPKALELMKERHEELNLDSDQRLPVKETIKATWKCYIPAVATGVTSTACIILASSKHRKRNAALAAAYKLSETAFTEYREKVVETIGAKKEEAVRDNLAKDKVEKSTLGPNEVIVTGKGETLCMDYQTGRTFKSDIDHIKRAINQLNYQMLNNEYVSLNDFYDEVGLSHTDMGYNLGWRVDKGQIKEHLSAQLLDGNPCIVVNFVNPPTYGYSSFT